MMDNGPAGAKDGATSRSAMNKTPASGGLEMGTIQPGMWLYRSQFAHPLISFVFVLLVAHQTPHMTLVS